MNTPTYLLVGAGDRGRRYAEYFRRHPEHGRIVAIAEPVEALRTPLADIWDIPETRVFRDWKDAVSLPRLADAVMICTQDHLHEDPAVAFADLGYHMLLEKPMAPTASACMRIADAVRRNGILFSVCHVLRYSPATQAIRRVIDAGEIGSLVSLQRLEPIGYWHFAHSFVRGNWSREETSSPILLSKSCHDIDWIHYIMGKPCTSVSSFGSLRHFRPDERPANSADRCLDCAIESECPYSAPRLYINRLKRDETWWPVDTVVPNPSIESVTEALRSERYGECVYNGRNDVLDNQIVNLQFDDGTTASLTLTAFTPHESRHTRMFGTRGMISESPSGLEVYDFLTDSRIEVPLEEPADAIGTHDGGDQATIAAFAHAVRTHDNSFILSGVDETLESHLIVFAAEESRHACTIEEPAAAHRRNR